MTPDDVAPENDAADSSRPVDDPALLAQQIAASLARLRGPRPGRGEGGGPWSGFGPGGGRGRGLRPLHDTTGAEPNGADHQRGPHSHGHGPHGLHDHDNAGVEAGARSRGPGSRDHGPLGRFAARLRLLEALAAASTPLSVSEVAERIGVDQPRASRLVQAGVDSGHVRREADESDARRTRIVLTDEGRAVISQARGARVGAVEQALSDFSAHDQAQLAALLARLADAWPRS